MSFCFNAFALTGRSLSIDMGTQGVALGQSQVALTGRRLAPSYMLLHLINHIMITVVIGINTSSRRGNR